MTETSKGRDERAGLLKRSPSFILQSEPIDSKLSSLNMAEKGVTVVLRVKKSKFAYIF